MADGPAGNGDRPYALRQTFYPQGRSDGGVYRYIYPIKSVTVLFTCVWDINVCFEIAMTTPNQIPGYDRVYLDLYLQQGALTE